MTVSIIIPMYNCENYIDECIISCIHQGKIVKEIIIVDDHSTDTSAAKALKYMSSYPDLVSYFLNDKKGACSARNYGYKMSTGNYIQFLDADDILGEDKIEEQLKNIETKPNSIANCGWIKFKSNIKDGSYRAQNIDKSYDKPIEWLIDSWNGNGVGAIHSWLIPRNLIEKAGGWNESLLKNQDGEFLARVIANSTSIQFNPRVFTYYRAPSETNVSSNISEAAIRSLLNSYKLYEIILTKNQSTEVVKAISRNYLDFIYKYYNLYPNLAKKAIEYVHQLSTPIIIPFQNEFVKFLNSIIGYQVIFKTRKLIKGY